MTQPSERPPPGGESGLGNMSFPGGNDGADYPINSAPAQAQNRCDPRAAANSMWRRRQRLVEHLHRLGPAPLGHFLREVEVATWADVTARLERYASIDPGFVRALGGDRYAPLLHVMDGDRAP